jgi:hypothetical protein
MVRSHLTTGFPWQGKADGNRTMSKQAAQQPTTEPQTKQTPFERFKAAAASEVISFPKSSALKTPKKKINKK